VESFFKLKHGDLQTLRARVSRPNSPALSFEDLRAGPQVTQNALHVGPLVKVALRVRLSIEPTLTDCLCSVNAVHAEELSLRSS
jgi:hypothetical protein